MHDPVDVVHEGTGRVTTVPRHTVRTLALHGWRLVSEPEPVVVDFDTDDEDSTGVPWVTETYERVTPRFDSSTDES